VIIAFTAADDVTNVNFRFKQVVTAVGIYAANKSFMSKKLETRIIGIQFAADNIGLSPLQLLWWAP